MKLPSERKGRTHRFVIGGHKGYLIHNTDENGNLAEISIRMAKVGSTVWGYLDAVAILASIALQRGEPLHEMARHFVGVFCEPNGPTTNPEIPVASSVLDYVFVYLTRRYPVKP